MLIRRCLIDAGDPELVHYEEVRELYRRKFDEDPLYKVVPYKDMPETLQGGSAEASDTGIAGIWNDHSGVPSDDIFSDPDRCDHGLAQKYLQSFAG